MSGRRGTERRKLSGKALTVRLAPEIRAAIDIAAAEAGITEASWIREVIAHEFGAPADYAVPVKAYRQPAPLPPGHILELARLRELVAELGGAMVQAAIGAREDGRGQLHAEVEALIPGVRRAVRDLDRLKIGLLGVAHALPPGQVRAGAA